MLVIIILKDEKGKINDKKQFIFFNNKN